MPNEPLTTSSSDLPSQSAAFEELVAVVDIGLVMLVVMIFERLARHVGGERVVGIRQVGQFERHYVLLGPLKEKCRIIRHRDETGSSPGEFLNQAN